MLSSLSMKELQSVHRQLECCQEQCGVALSQHIQSRSTSSVPAGHSSVGSRLHSWSIGDASGMPSHTTGSETSQRLATAQRRDLSNVFMRASFNHDVCRTHAAAPTPQQVSSRSYAAPAQKPAEPPHGIEKAPLIPYDSDENSATGVGLAPFIPPSIEKLINVIMRHGKKEVARGIVFDASHALYNAARDPNPRPELQQRRKEFMPK